MVNRSIGQAFVVFALLGAALYANALGNSFHYDDRHSIEHNKHLRSLANIPSYFVDPGTFSSERRGTMFRPLLLSSYAANYAVHGGWVPGYRIANLLIHVLCSTLPFALAHKWWGIPRDAWALGLLFLLHPLHGEPINYISSRSELLVALFFCFLDSLFKRLMRTELITSIMLASSFVVPRITVCGICFNSFVEPCNCFLMLTCFCMFHRNPVHTEGVMWVTFQKIP